MTKMVAITVASLLFRRHDPTTGGDPLQVVTTRQDVLEHPYDNPSFDFNLVTRALGVSPDPYEPDEGYLPGYATLMARIEIDKGDTHSVSDPPGVPEDDIYRAMIDEDEHELEWHYDPENIDDSFFKADIENVHVLAGAIDQVQFHRFIRGVLQGGSIGNISLTTSALMAVILVETTPSQRTYLIIATGEIVNDDQEIDPVPPIPPPFPDPQLYELHTPNYYGRAPVFVEGMAADITLPYPPDRVEWRALDPTGAPGDPLPMEDLITECRLHLSLNHETLWYKLVISL